MLEVFGISIALTFALGILIWLNLRTSNESESSAISRILITYVQIFTTAAAYNLNWPYYVKSFFGVFTGIGNVS